jgi:hypothetical protein
MVARIDKVMAMLDAALAEKHVGSAEPLIKEALALCKRGVVEPGDHARLTLLLNEIRSALKETTDVEEK